ncbi:MAG: NADH-quinone oxidoreductase subunit L, partial [Rhodobacter sp.]|nr:NADH-quinone oxidoreductase subunit L [Rhodobacter sp.]
LGIFALFFLVDSVRFDDVFAAGPVLAETSVRFLWADWNAANLIGVLLFIGAMGKSAQLFLHTWLPDAMEGPTPVSALIHAATMVTAGVFLVCRMSPVFEYAPDARTMIVVIGATTAFFAATVGLVQNDIKRVIAYSTCSQLGYMFVAAGVGVYSVAMFHLFTHAFFKAMLFLGAGSVIHAMHHEQDMRNYGGLRKKVPLTFWAMMTGTLAITGVGIPLTHIGFAGFLSKDAVIESAYVGSQYAFWLLVIAAFMTSFYSWRLMFMTFFGAPRGDHHAHDHAHESPKMMLIPLAVLALGAVFSGMLWYKVFFGDEAKVRSWFGMPAGIEHAGAGHGAAGEAVAEDHAATTASGGEAVADDPAAATASGEEAAAGDHAATTAAQGEAAAQDHATTAVPAAGQAGPAPVQGALFFGPDNQMIHKAHGVPDWVKVSPFAAMILGLALAFQFYIRRPDLPGRLAANQRPLYLFLLNKWYFDEVYEFLFVRSAKWLGGFLWKRGDGAVIDGTINGVALGIVPFFTRLAGRAQTGYVFTYAFAMVLGIAVLVTWMTLSGGAE